jgi:hypothetical protein
MIIVLDEANADMAQHFAAMFGHIDGQLNLNAFFPEKAQEDAALRQTLVEIDAKYPRDVSWALATTALSPLPQIFMSWRPCCAHGTEIRAKLW